MRRNTINFWLNAVSFAAMVGLLFTGLLVHWVLPAGSGGRGRGLALAVFGLGRHDWGDIHFWLAVVASGLMVAHLWLHWSWVTCMVTRLLRLSRPSSRVATLAGVGLLAGTVALVAGALLLARGQVHVGVTRPPERTALQSDAAPRSGAPETHATLAITGRTTVGEAASRCGRTVADLCRQLHLPATTDPGEQLGRLRRRHGFTIQDVRALAVD